MAVDITMAKDTMMATEADGEPPTTEEGTIAIMEQPQDSLT